MIKKFQSFKESRSNTLTCCKDLPGRFTRNEEYTISNTDDDFYYLVDDNGEEYKLPKKTTEGHEYFFPPGYGDINSAPV